MRGREPSAAVQRTQWLLAMISVLALTGQPARLQASECEQQYPTRLSSSAFETHRPTEMNGDMDEILYRAGELEVRKRGQKYVLRYDVGTIATVMREDEISEDEALYASQGADQAATVVRKVMDRIRARQEDPNKSNFNDW